MPSCDEHKLKMEHNKEFLSICRANNPKDHKGVYYYDWEIVVEFYACVHLVEAVLKKKFDIDSVDHNKRREFMEKNKDIFTDDVMESYTALLEYSHQARYKPLTYSTKKKAYDAQLCMDALEANLCKYLKWNHQINYQKSHTNVWLFFDASTSK